MSGLFDGLKLSLPIESYALAARDDARRTATALGVLHLGVASTHHPNTAARSRFDAPCVYIGRPVGLRIQNHPTWVGSRTIRSDALKYQRALGWNALAARDDARRTADTFRCTPSKCGLQVHPRSIESTTIRSDALKCKRAFGWYASAVRSGVDFPAAPDWKPRPTRRVYVPVWSTIWSEGNEDSTPAVRRQDGI